MNIIKNNKKLFILSAYVGSMILIMIGMYFFLFSNFQAKINSKSNSKNSQNRYNQLLQTLSGIKRYELSIPALNIEAPIITGVDPSDKIAYNRALKKGVLLMQDTAHPGKIGNVFIYGHSSSNENGNYKKIFATLNKLQTDDEIIITKGDNQYNYYVIDKKIVEPEDLSVLDQGTEKMLTLMTCWPIGTNDKRLIIQSLSK